MNRFDFLAPRLDGAMIACLVLVWLIVVGCAISSLREHTSSKSLRKLWIFIIVAFPLVGLLIYLPFAMDWKRHMDNPLLKAFRDQDEKRPYT